jgi:magnesium transporter
MSSNKSLIKRFSEAPFEEKIPFILNLNRHWRRQLLSQLSDQEIADILAYSDEDDAVNCLDILSSSRREAILRLLHSTKREKVKRLLAFAPQTAGRLIDSNFIEISLITPISQITQKVKNHYTKFNKPPTIIVENEKGRKLGTLPLERLIINDWKTPKDLRLRKLPTVPHTLDQEKLIEKVSGTSANIIAVVDDKNRTLGIIRTKDLLQVLKQEATEDFYKFAGVPAQEHIFDSPLRSVKLRSKWLIINLFTALLDVIVISFFKDTVEQVVILAAFMPVVAGMGGNAGTQTLAVMVRGIATGEIKFKTAHWVVLKEIGAGLLNGVITGVIVGIIAFIWQGSALLGIILFAAMVINLLVAGLFGAIIPLFLKALRIDPAIASSIFITTATDIFGFLAFLSLATWLLL